MCHFLHLLNKYFMTNISHNVPSSAARTTRSPEVTWTCPPLKQGVHVAGLLWTHDQRYCHLLPKCLDWDSRLEAHLTLKELTVQNRRQGHATTILTPGLWHERLCEKGAGTSAHSGQGRRQLVQRKSLGRGGQALRTSRAQGRGRVAAECGGS